MLNAEHEKKEEEKKQLERRILLHVSLYTYLHIYYIHTQGEYKETIQAIFTYILNYIVGYRTHNKYELYV